MMESIELQQFLEFLQHDLAIPDDHLRFALRHFEQSPNVLPIILWEYGLATLAEVNCMFDWLENHVSG